MRTRATTEDLVRAASAPYWKTDFTGYFKARGKLRGDPAFTKILSEGLLAGARRILDLGCGQGLLAAWLEAARSRHDERPHLWPREWPAAPRPVSYRGIELRRQEVWRAQIALGSRAQFEVGDISQADFGSVDAVVILDVIHYLEHRAQLHVLDRARAAMSSGGILLLRVSDADGGIRFKYGKYVDLTVMAMQYRRAPRVYCRSVPEWQRLLASLGFQVEATPMSAGTPFANTMLVAHAHPTVRQPHSLMDSLITHD
ncbi:MAG: class I SAM-dependent methyltransferase [Proteobacteria bacterium]|nr:class I SAM-dependent methyltransferase [Pseudomonadota bacterium]